MAIPRQEVSHEFVNERMRLIDQTHAREAMLSNTIVDAHPEIRALVPKGYRG